MDAAYKSNISPASAFKSRSVEDTHMVFTTRNINKNATNW